MLVKWKTNPNGISGFAVGTVVDVQDSVGSVWLAHGWVEQVKEPVAVHSAEEAPPVDRSVGSAKRRGGS